MGRSTIPWLLLSMTFACGEPPAPEMAAHPAPVDMEAAPRRASPEANDEELAFCPEPREYEEPEDFDPDDPESLRRELEATADMIQLFVQLEHHGFALAGTDGTYHPMRYDGEAYPRDELRDQLEERRRIEPYRRQVLIVNDPFIPNAVADAVLADARALGYEAAMRCRIATGLDRLTSDDYEGPERGEPSAGSDPMEGVGSLNGDEPRGSGGLRGRTARVPQVRPDRPEVGRALSVEVVRRVVRRHVNEVRFCYEQALNADPDLAGRVVVRFTIGGTGAVSSSEIESSTVEREGVGVCIAQALRHWTFPAPDGGAVVDGVQAFELRTD